jgi:hypothetical protein
MIRFISTAVFLAFLFSVNSSRVCGQVTPAPIPGPRNPPTTGPWNTEQQRLNEQIREAYDSLSGPDGRSNFGRDALRAYYFESDVMDRLEKMLKPTRAERAGYAQTLKQPHTGLVKLLPQTARVVSFDKLRREKASPSMFPGGGAYYSFTRLDHSSFGADLTLKGGSFEVAFGPDVLGALTTLGDVPIDSLTAESSGVSVLAKYTRPVDWTKARNEQERFKGGVNRDGYAFQTQVPVHENTTYALRSIAYGRSDLLVAVRVVKQNDDGSVLLLWKRLDKFSAPKLKRTARR